MEEPQNANGSSIEGAEEDAEAVVGPAPPPKARAKRPLQFEQAYLDSLPSANMYAFHGLLCHFSVSGFMVFFNSVFFFFFLN